MAEQPGDRAYVRGWNAYQGGKQKTANPFPTAPENTAWAAGWEAAAKDHDRLQAMFGKDQ